MNEDAILRWLRSRRVAVLKGGWSSERPISLKTGAAVEAAFRRLGVKAVGIDVTPNISHVLKTKKIQFCFNALHGPFGEDGRIQGLLDILKIPYTGSGPLANAVAMNKSVAKQLFSENGVPTPKGTTIDRSDYEEKGLTALKDAFVLLQSGPVFVKPVDQGSAIGVSSAKTKGALLSAIKKALVLSHGALVERLIVGRELTVGILGDVALPVTEIIAKHDFYDFYSKYSKGGSRHLTPAPISMDQAKRAQKLAKAAFRALQCSVYGRVDVMMTARGEMFVLEVNTIPGMTDVSLFPEAAKAVGIGFDELVLRIVDLSLIARRVIR